MKWGYCQNPRTFLSDVQSTGCSTAYGNTGSCGTICLKACAQQRCVSHSVQPNTVSHTIRSLQVRTPVNKETGNTSHHVCKRLWLPPSLSLLYDLRTYRARRFEKDRGNNNARFQLLVAVFLKIRVFLGIIVCRRVKSGNRSCTLTESTQKTLYNEQTKISFDSNCWRTCEAAQSPDRLTHWK
jgi:hypothetical protein